MSWDERFDRWGQAIGARYWLWMLGVLLLAGGLMSISLAIAPFVMLLPEFSPTGSVLAAREMGRMQAQQGVATQSNEVQTQQQYVVETFVVIFRHRAGGNLLSAPVLQRIKGMEDAILNYPGYEELCMRTAGVDPPVCQPPASIVNEAYASKRSLGGDAEITVLDRLGNLTDDPAGAIFGAVDDGTEWLLQLLAKDDACRHPPHHCTYARTLFLLAGPLAGYSNLQERKQEQAARVLAFLEKITRDVLRPLAHNSSEPVQIVFTGDEMWRYELNVYIYRDAMMTTGSFALLFSYFVLHTRSVILSTLAVATIVLAFPTSYFVYRTVFGCDVNGLTVMAMFVVLGVAADDIFIVTDNWRRSRFAPRDGGLGRFATAAERAGFVLRHAAPAMAITSATTISAFMTATLSMIPTIRLFGFFAAIVVASNYILVCTFFLASLAMYEENVRRRDWLLRKRAPRMHKDISVESNLDGAAGAATALGAAGACGMSRTASLRLSRPPSVTFAPDAASGGGAAASARERAPANGARRAGAGGEGVGATAEPRRIVEVFTADELAVLTGAVDDAVATTRTDGPPLVATTRTDGPPLVAGTARAAARAAAAGAPAPAPAPTLAPPTAAVGGYGTPTRAPACRMRSGGAAPSPLSRPPSLAPTLSKRFSSAEDLAMYNMGAPQRFLDRFFPQTYVPFADRHRRALLGVFALIVFSSAVVGSRFRLEDKASMMLPAKSNIETFRAWTENFPPTLDGGAVKIHFLWGIVGIDRSHVNSADPDDHGRVLFNPAFDAWADQEAICAFCESLSAPAPDEGGHAADAWTAAPSQAECPMIGFREYRRERNLTWPVPTRARFADRLSDYLATPDGFGWAHKVGLAEGGTSVVWLDVAVVSSLLKSQHGAVLHEHYDHWEAVALSANAQLNFTSPVFQTSESWKQMATLDSLASTAIVGIVCSLTFATSCMLAVTGEWRLTMFATMTICAIVVTLVAAYVLMGRTLGFMESVNLAIVSGLAVDYTLHIAHLYQHSHKPSRLEKVQEAMSLVGISIFSGATTTLLASSMLFCAYIKMSQAFGATIFLSILFSFIYALGLFVPLLLEFGPLAGGADGDLQCSDDDDGSGSDFGGGLGGVGSAKAGGAGADARGGNGWTSHADAVGARVGEWGAAVGSRGAFAPPGGERAPMLDRTTYVDSSSLGALDETPHELPSAAVAPELAAESAVASFSPSSEAAAGLAGVDSAPEPLPPPAIPAAGADAGAQHGAGAPVANGLH